MGLHQLEVGGLARVAEATGVDRAVLAFLCEAFEEQTLEGAVKEGGEKGEDDVRTVLHLHPRLAPVKVAIFPLVKKEGMPELAMKLEDELRSRGVSTFYDQSGAIGRRYRRQDEVGTPWCVTVDGESLSAGTVTVRERDSMQQSRVRADELVAYVAGRLAG